MTYSIGQQVTVKKGHLMGMKQLNADTQAKVIRFDKDVKGNAIACVEWYDYKGNRKTTWISANE